MVSLLEAQTPRGELVENCCGEAERALYVEPAEVGLTADVQVRQPAGWATHHSQSVFWARAVFRGGDGPGSRIGPAELGTMPPWSASGAGMAVSKEYQDA
ncbi:MAG TPA: hypothetical protein VMV23_08445 [Candidatus Nanopelagicaceae bacterium]|nr:hypothetical protein [Candidatus Nanopelagicaceae bacterium]